LGGDRAGGVGCYLPATVIATRLARRLNLPDAALWIAACLVATLPMTVVSWAANGIWHLLTALSAVEWLSLYANVLVLGSAVTSIFWFGRHRRGGTPAVETPTAAPPPVVEVATDVPFLDRLPPLLGRDLIALEMEDHYVRAHTAAGSTLILKRMRDAAAELAAIDGQTVHRSWWVARAHVTGTARDGRNVRLLLANGIEAPVARGQAEALQAAGWLRNAAVPPSAAIG
jgi:DNA-binding LytR/AlgR family response regulator